MIADAVRLLRAAMVLARHGALEALAPPDLPAPARAGLSALKFVSGGFGGPRTGSRRLADALTDLGPSYIKLGQFLATRPDVVGARMAADLTALQDKMAPFPLAKARAAIKSELGTGVDELFASFSEPVAAASIAQVHKATLAEGATRRDVAVKVLRPGVVRRFRRDLSSFYLAARIAERWHPASRRLRPLAIVDTLAAWVALEMDLRMEAAAISEMSENIANDDGFRVPMVDWERSAKRVLTLDWVDAIKLNDIAAVEAAGHDLEQLSQTLIQSFLRHAIRDGFFHADMHPGNLFVEAGGDIVAVDFGIMGRLGPKERRFLAEILLGFINRDYTRVAQVHFEAGYVPRHHRVADFAQALRAIGEPLMGRRAEDISMARLLTQLFEVTELFDMQTRPELLLLQKTMVVVEGVARELDPKLNMWTTAEPVVREWMEQSLGPEGRLQDAAEGAASLGRFVGQIPGLLSRAEEAAAQWSQMAEGGLRLDARTVDALARAERRHNRSTHIALWIGALSLAAIALSLIL
jgi:ubiquinone biosynthesis protein